MNNSIEVNMLSLVHGHTDYEGTYSSYCSKNHANQLT